jgi:hypothetical protein
MVFVALLAVVGVVIVVALLTRTDQPTLPPGAAPPAAPDYSLTNAEALARFKELDALRNRALEERDFSRLSEIFTPTSKAGERVRTSIRKLNRSGVHVSYRLETNQAKIIEAQPDVIRVEQRVVFDTSFADEAGNDMTIGGGLERQVIRWTLQRVGSVWLLDDGLIIKAKELPR